MPSTKKEKSTKAKSPAKRKTRTSTTSKKKTTTVKSGSSATKKKAPRKTSAGKSKTKSISIDVIADDDDLLSQDEFVNYLADEQEKDSSQLDVQKKFYSDLVSEIKDKNGVPEDIYPEIPEGELKVMPEIKEAKTARKSIHLYRRIAFRFIALTVVFLAIVAYFFVPSLKIVIHPGTESLSDSVSLNVVPPADLNSAATRSIAGQVKNVDLKAEKSYPATGEEVLGEEVTGEVTIYNNYSKDQPLVAKTRLLSPDNKLFRIKESVTVPAGGSVKVPIYTDQPSQDMAIAPAHFTIPGLWLGLQDKIYAVSSQAFVYSHKIQHYVRQQDLDQAMNDIKKVLETKAKQTVSSLNTGGVSLAYSLNNQSDSINLGASLNDKVDSFTVSASNTLGVALFSREQAEALVKAKLAFLMPDDKRLSSFESSDINYKLESIDLNKGTAVVSADFTGDMSLRTDSNLIDKRRLVNLSEGQISKYLSSFPEIKSYELHFSPSFLKKAPSLADRIKIQVQ